MTYARNTANLQIDPRNHMNKDPMTQAQRNTICKAYEMLGEQFEHILIVVNYETADDSTNDATEAFWKGGYISALGLAAYANDRILKTDNHQSYEPS